MMPWPTHIVAVAGLVEDGKGNVLLAKSRHRQTWEICGGQVELGEDLEQAVIREIKEESHIDVSVRCLAGLYSSIKQTIWYDGVTKVPPKVIVDFICNYVGGEPGVSNETSEVIWCPREQVLDRITHPTMKLRIANLLNFRGSVHYSVYSSRPFQEHHSRFV